MEGKYTQHYAQHDIVTPAQNPQLVTSQIEDFSYMDDSIFLNPTAPDELLFLDELKQSFKYININGILSNTEQINFPATTSEQIETTNVQPMLNTTQNEQTLFVAYSPIEQTDSASNGSNMQNSSASLNHASPIELDNSLGSLRPKISNNRNARNARAFRDRARQNNHDLIERINTTSQFNIKLKNKVKLLERINKSMNDYIISLLTTTS